MPETYAREDRGPILGYGCQRCHLAWHRDDVDVHPIQDATSHAYAEHGGDLDVVVDIRDEDPWPSTDEGGEPA